MNVGAGAVEVGEPAAAPSTPPAAATSGSIVSSGGSEELRVVDAGSMPSPSAVPTVESDEVWTVCAAWWARSGLLGDAVVEADSSSADLELDRDPPGTRVMELKVLMSLTDAWCATLLVADDTLRSSSPPAPTGAAGAPSADTAAAGAWCGMNAASVATNPVCHWGVVMNAIPLGSMA